MLKTGDYATTDVDFWRSVRPLKRAKFTLLCPLVNRSHGLCSMFYATMGVGQAVGDFPMGFQPL